MFLVLVVVNRPCTLTLCFGPFSNFQPPIQSFNCNRHHRYYFFNRLLTMPINMVATSRRQIKLNFLYYNILCQFEEIYDIINIMLEELGEDTIPSLHPSPPFYPLDIIGPFPPSPVFDPLKTVGKYK